MVLYSAVSWTESFAHGISRAAQTNVSCPSLDQALEDPNFMLFRTDQVSDTVAPDPYTQRNTLMNEFVSNSRVYVHAAYHSLVTPYRPLAKNSLEPK